MSEVDEVVVAAEMDEVDRLWVSLLKDAFTVGKCSFTVITTLMAAQKWRKHTDMRMAKPAQLLLILNAVIVASVTVYKSSSKRISPLFLLQGLSHYSSFLVFVILWTYGDDPKMLEQRRKLGPVIAVMHAAWFVILTLGYAKCTCSPETPYPDSFLWSDLLFFATYFLLRKLRKAGLDFPETDDVSKKPLLQVQVENYFKFYSLLAKWHALELLLGKVLFESVLEGAVYCSASGDAWLYRNVAGSLFLVLHILGTAQATGMARTVFIKNPKSVGFFDGFDDEAEDDSTKKTS